VAEYPMLTKADLVTYSARPAESYRDAQVATALAQATLLFKIGTCLAALPDEPDKAELAKMAILAYADHIVLSLPHAKALASPFNSESLGSYSYSKSAGAVAKGEKTGVFWFDLAIERLSVCMDVDDALDYGGIEIMEHDGLFVKGSGEGNVRYLTPGDVAASRAYGFDIVLSRN
jgi:hypothetical protein